MIVKTPPSKSLKHNGFGVQFKKQTKRPLVCNERAAVFVFAPRRFKTRSNTNGTNVKTNFQAMALEPTFVAQPSSRGRYDIVCVISIQTSSPPSRNPEHG